MRVLATVMGVVWLASSPGIAAQNHKGALDDTTDIFGLITPDHLLGATSRREWLDLHPVLAKVYWAAWDCKGKPCDTPQRAHYRAIAKLIPRTEKDPPPGAAAASSSQ
jgi:hypothetical protein